MGYNRQLYVARVHAHYCLTGHKESPAAEDAPMSASQATTGSPGTPAVAGDTDRDPAPLLGNTFHGPPAMMQGCRVFQDTWPESVSFSV